MTLIAGGGDIRQIHNWPEFRNQYKWNQIFNSLFILFVKILMFSLNSVTLKLVELKKVLTEWYANVIIY
jgi:hypothetical protein